ncbi:flagellar biosynthesis regulator FlaF [Hwanghaeella sp.]|uniref:flagellar biosynthesis regulator FlaF n=1 Tax=Hwanghaeella sp. TaxID=2605943 RepID=UPI003CCC11FC
MSNPYASQQRSQLENAAPQAAEGWALVETARRLESAKRNPDDSNAILSAVRVNWRIWTIIQSSLVDPECPLPQEIRENLLNLSRFIDRRSAELIASPQDVHKLDVLINIDRQIGAGLLGNPADGEEAQRPAAPADNAENEPRDNPPAEKPAPTQSGTHSLLSVQETATPNPTPGPRGSVTSTET